jgi:hypothetical protein
MKCAAAAPLVERDSIKESFSLTLAANVKRPGGFLG